MTRLGRNQWSERAEPAWSSVEHTLIQKSRDANGRVDGLDGARAE
jgi:hypothetical protein